MPTLDYILLNVGKDGRIGGLYPDSKEIQITDPSQLILPVDKVFFKKYVWLDYRLQCCSL